jgi:hypothetical protein
MDAGSFQNVKNQIGFCGIWCGSCAAGNGALREVTKRYAEMIKTYGLPEWGPREVDFEGFTTALMSIQAMPRCQGCRKGDGKPNCEFRVCASGKKAESCTECGQSAVCENSEALQKMREGALNAGLKVQTKKSDQRELIEDWTAELKGMWPHLILFMSDDE